MKRFVQAIFSVSLLVMLANGARADNVQNLRFIDELGNPLPDVVVRVTRESSAPGMPGGTSDVKTDATGTLNFTYPCVVPSGSCCMLIKGIFWQIIGRPGYKIAAATGGAISGGVTCSLGTSNFIFTGIREEFANLAVGSAARYSIPLTGDMMVAAFGNNLATTTAAATEIPAPTTLGGRQVFVRDSKGVDRAARLLYVSPTQMNFVTPMQDAGSGAVFIRDESNQLVSACFTTVANVAPGIFTANADGQGVPSAYVVRVKPDNSQLDEPLLQFDAAQGKYVPIALDLGPDGDIVVLVLFGTGWRQVTSVNEVSVKIGGVDCPVDYVGKQPTYEGMAQINARLPRTLIGQGDANVDVTIRGVPANIVQLKFKSN